MLNVNTEVSRSYIIKKIPTIVISMCRLNVYQNRMAMTGGF